MKSQKTLSLARQILGIGIIGSLVTFAGVGLICIYLFGLEPIWSAIIAMFSAFGTITATMWISNKSKK